MLDAVMQAAGANEGYEVRTFLVYLPRGIGSREVRVEVLDAGSDAGSQRYTVTATATDNEDTTTTSNPGGTLKEALHGVHWRELDLGWLSRVDRRRLNTSALLAEPRRHSMLRVVAASRLDSYALRSLLFRTAPRPRRYAMYAEAAEQSGAGDAEPDPDGCDG